MTLIEIGLTLLGIASVYLSIGMICEHMYYFGDDEHPMFINLEDDEVSWFHVLAWPLVLWEWLQNR